MRSRVLIRLGLRLGFALMLAGCGTWSNEDIEYLYALPQRDMLKSQLTSGSDGKALSVGDPSTTYDNTKTQSDAFNAFIDGVLTGLDTLKTIPPTTRTKSSRIWGWYPDGQHPGFEVRVTIERESDSLYKWTIDERPKGGDSFTLGGGEFTPTASLRKGVGHFGFDAKLSREKLGGGKPSDPDTVEIRYKTDGDPLMVEIDFDVADAGSVGYGYNGYADKSAVLAYVLDTPSNPDATKLSVSAGWSADTSGRADWLILAGKFAMAHGVECWDPGHTVVYAQGYADGGMYVVGDMNNCAKVQTLMSLGTPDGG